MRLNDLDFHVEVAGEGPPLLLLHGFTGSARSWDQVVADLGPVANVITVDLIGHGRSAAPPDPRRYSMDAAAKDLVALLDQLRLGDVAVLGYSMGGRLALYFAVHHSSRVRALILESASAGIEDTAERTARVQSDAILADRLEGDGLEAFIAFWEAQPLLEPARHVTDAVRRQQHAIRLEHSAQGLANSLRGMGAGSQPALWSALPGLNVPTLLLTGDSDTRYCAMASQMCALLPRAEHQVIHAAGHTAHVDQPVEFTRSVRVFVERQFRTN